MNADRKNLPRRHGGTEESQNCQNRQIEKAKTYTGLANEHLEFLILVSFHIVSFHLLAEAD